MKLDFLRATVLAFVLLQVAACGQRGPLYLPSQATAATPANTSSAKPATPSSTAVTK